MTTPRQDPPGARWTSLDSVMLAALTALGGALRFAGITRPPDFIFDEFYASDGCLYVLGPTGPCRTTAEIGIAHPPLAKWLIGAGVRVFGFEPAGWRVAPLAVGTASLALLYLLARRVLGSTLAASLATGLLAFDFLHFVLSRAAMLDAFVVCFGLAAFLFLMLDRDRPAAERPAPVRSLRTLSERRWLLAAGLAGGAAVASKWSGGYLLAAVLALAFAHGVSRRRAQGELHPYRRTVRAEGGLLALALVLVPLLLYVGSYAGRLDGSLFAWPWARGSWARAFVARQQLMIAHHTGALFTHPYASPAWAWPLLKRPVLFYFRNAAGGGYREILALGNPLIWWPALLATALALWRALRQPRAAAPETIVAVGFAAGYLPWFILSRQEAFLYYMLPAVPFMYLALARAAAGIATRPLRGAACGALALAAIGLFAFFHPVLTGAPLDYPAWQRRMLFRACGPADPAAPLKPVVHPVPPPHGWCWV